MTHTGEYIVDVSTRACGGIANKTLDRYQNCWDPMEPQHKPFVEFADMNRDWRRIAVTEINGLNSGNLTSIL